MPINADKPHLWKADTRASVDQFNQWFMKFAPKAYRDTRKKTIESVEQGLALTEDLSTITPDAIKANPGILPTLRMSTCPPLARDRLIGLADSTKNFVGCLEQGKLPRLLSQELLEEHLGKITGILSQMLDVDIFPGIFLLQCHDWMEEQGLAIWLIPSEFMDVNYGATLRRYLTERVTLLHIHRFCPTDVQFTDALVSSAVVVFRKALPLLEHRVRFSFAGPIESPTTEALVPLDVLCHSRKWTQFPARTNFENTDEPILGDLFFIKRGLATGSNSFFIMDSEQVKEWNIPRQFLKPILPGPRYITTDVIDAHPNGDPAVSPRIYLLDCNEPEERIEKRWPRFYQYLQKGREEKIAASYLASHRAPWYSQEKRPPAPFLCTYMGRSRNAKHPFRFIWNRSQATAHNVYLMLYPKSRLQEALNNNPELAVKVFEALQSITPGQFISEGRVYGGGLHKVEPKELAQIPARAVLESIEGHFHLERQEKLFA